MLIAMTLTEISFLEKRPLTHCWWDCELVQPLWKSVWRYLKKLGMGPPFNPAIPLFGSYPKELKSAFYSDTFLPMFIAVYLTIVMFGTSSRYLSTDKWMKKM